MSTKSERKEVLDSLEDEYRSDLAVHLYSALLWRKINPNYHSKWSTWPLRFLEVPCPKTSIKYADTIIEPDRYGHDIDVDEEATTIMINEISKERNDKAIYRKLYLPIKKRKIDILNEEETGRPKSHEIGTLEQDENDSLNEPHKSTHGRRHEDTHSHKHSQRSHEDHHSDLEQDSEDSNDNSESGDESQNKLHRAIHFTERITNSKADLVNELNSQIEGKIRQRLQNLMKEGKVNEGVQISLAISGDLTKLLGMKLAHKVDDVLNQFTEMRSKPNQKEARWFHILLAALNAEESPYSSFSTKTYGELYDKCEELFERCDFEYQFDDEQEDDEESMYIKHQVMASGKFDVKKYLELIKKLEESMESKSELTEPKPESMESKPEFKPDTTITEEDGKYFDLDNGETAEDSIDLNTEDHGPSLAHQLSMRQLFINKLKVQSKYDSLYWNRKRPKQSLKKPETLSEQRKLAVDSGYNLLDTEEYILRDY